MNGKDQFRTKAFGTFPLGQLKHSRDCIIEIRSKEINGRQERIIHTILEDDSLFRELKERMRTTEFTTNAGIGMALNTFLLNSMSAEVESKYSTESKSASPPPPQIGALPFRIKPLESLQNIAKNLSFRRRLSDASSSGFHSVEGSASRNVSLITPSTSITRNFMGPLQPLYTKYRRLSNSKWEELSAGATSSNKILAGCACHPGNERRNSETPTTPKRRLLGARDFVRPNQGENLNNIKYKTMEELRPTRKLNFVSFISSVPLVGSFQQRRSFQECKPSYANYISNLSNEPMAKAGETVTNECVRDRSSGWSEEVIQELFEETVGGKRCSNWSEETYAKALGNDDMSVLSNDDSSSASTKMINNSTQTTEAIQDPSKIHFLGFSVTKIQTRRSPKKTTYMDARKQFCLENRNHESRNFNKSRGQFKLLLCSSDRLESGRLGPSHHKKWRRPLPEEVNKRNATWETVS